MAQILFSILTYLLLTSFAACSPLRELQSSPPQQQPCNYSTQACGGLPIPYPFGMSDECGLSDYRIVCKVNTTYGDGDLPFLQINTYYTTELQVLSFQTNQLIVNSTQLRAAPSSDSCNDAAYAALELRSNGTFILSDDNWLVVVGCSFNGSCLSSTIENPANRALLGYTTSCSNFCFNDTPFTTFCDNHTCCISPIPPHSWWIYLEGAAAAGSDDCGFSTALNPTTFKVPSNGLNFSVDSHYGVSLSWALLPSSGEESCSMIEQSVDYACQATAACIYDEWLRGYTCNCTKGYRGDGYTAGIGCQDINECEENLDDCEKPPLGKCTNTNGSYICSCVYGAGGKSSGLPGTCSKPANILKPMLIGGSIAAIILVVALAFVCTLWQAYRKRKQRRENFHRAGGDKLNSFLFTEKELSDATDSFSKSHVVGEGGFGEVYWGSLSKRHGKTKVAIKKAKPKGGDQQMAQMQSFVREIMLLSSAVHSNVVLLLGCCVETPVPLLVFEYVEKGNLSDYLNPSGSDCRRFPLKSTHSSLWPWRLHVAVQTAEALSYLHDREEPIFHLDLKPQNILIDINYSPKVADFGLSYFMASDATHLSNPLFGCTPGYVDPEYGLTYRITDKFDVYSFGVILLELISSWPAFSPAGGALSHRFCNGVNMKEELEKHSNHVTSFIDGRLESDAEALASINKVADVARKCVVVQGSDRPSMQEVHRQLKEVQAKQSGPARKSSGSGSRHGIAKKSPFFGATLWPSSNDDSQCLPLVYAEDSSKVSATSRVATQDKEAVNTSLGWRDELIELQPLTR